MSLFNEVKGSVGNTTSAVTEAITSARNNAASWSNAANGVFSALKGVNVGSVGAPAAPSQAGTVNANLTLPAIQPNSFGTVSSSVPQAPKLAALPAMDDLEIPDFKTSVGAIAVPAAPAWKEPGAAPSAPSVGTVAVPDAPNLQLPVLPQLADINVPSFAGLTMPQFTADAPEFQGSAISTVLQWAEPEYKSELLPELQAKIKELWSGKLGMPEAVEKAMFARAAEREQKTLARAIAGVAQEFSARGYTMPPGMQAARTKQVREDLAGAALGANRELTVQVAQWQIENIRFACQQTVAAENALINLHSNMAERMFQSAKFQVEAQLSVYNAQVALFNARMNAYEIKSRVFNTLVQAELARIQVFQAEVQAELARGQINEQKVKTYEAQVRALMANVEIFNGQLQGAKTKAELVKAEIEVFKGQVEAYAVQVGAQKTRFEAYEAQVKGEAAKAGIIDAEARAYAALVQGKSATADIDVKRVTAVLDQNKTLISQYAAELEAEKVRMQTQLAGIQTTAQAYQADTARLTAVAGAQAEVARAQIAAHEATMRTNLGLYQAEVQKFGTQAQLAISQAQVNVEAAKAAGQIASTMAAGAMAGIHVSASLSGSASMGVSASDSTSNSRSEITQINAGRQ